MGFENYVVDISEFINDFIFGATKILVVISIIVILLIVLFKPSKNFAQLLTKVPNIFLLTFKFAISYTMFIMVFFYNFENKQLIFIFPDKMLVSTLFVGILAFYEMFACTMAFFDIFFNIFIDTYLD